jgi:maltodextrin utilization protein YvdJ
MEGIGYMTWWWQLLLLFSFLTRLLQLSVRFTREEVWEIKVLSIEL